MKANDLVLKMIAETFFNTSFVDPNTLKVLKSSKSKFNVGEQYATKKSLQWCIDTYSEFVFTGKVTKDDLGVSEFLYTIVLSAIK